MTISAHKPDPEFINMANFELRREIHAVQDMPDVQWTPETQRRYNAMLIELERREADA